jgi:hypothetical protein
VSDTRASSSGAVSLASLALRMLGLMAAGVAGNAVRRTARQIGGWSIVAALCTFSVGFFSFAAFGFLASWLDSSYAGLILGAVYLVAALVLALILQSGDRRGRSTR